MEVLGLLIISLVLQLVLRLEVDRATLRNINSHDINRYFVLGPLPTISIIPSCCSSFNTFFAVD